MTNMGSYASMATSTEPEDAYARFQRNVLFAEKVRQYQELASKDAIFKLKIIGALVGFGILAAMVVG